MLYPAPARPVASASCPPVHPQNHSTNTQRRFSSVPQARSSPDDFVLKPQREGGGNNLYGPELAARLAEGGEGLAAYVLMQRIKPPVNRWAGGAGCFLGLFWLLFWSPPGWLRALACASSWAGSLKVHGARWAAAWGWLAPRLPAASRGPCLMPWPAHQRLGRADIRLLWDLCLGSPCPTILPLPCPHGYAVQCPQLCKACAATHSCAASLQLYADPHPPGSPGLL